MTRDNPRADVARIRQVLADVDFPAAKWQLVMHAEEYGADARTRADLWSLPAGGYPDVTHVLAALGLSGRPVLRPVRFRPQPGAQAAARDLPPR